MGLETYITLQEAEQRFSLDATLLTSMIDRGRIRGGKLNGTFVLLEDDARQMAEQKATKEQMRKKVAHLEGRPIGMREAARKYSLNNASISNWVRAGYIRVISQGAGRGHKSLVDESDVAYAKELVLSQNAGQGSRVFTSDFSPDWF